MSLLPDLMHWQRDHAARPRPDAVERRRVLLASGTLPMPRDLLEYVLIPRALRGREQLIHEHAAPMEGRIGLRTEVRLATTLDELLELALVGGDGDHGERRQRLEALATFDAVLGMAAMEAQTTFAQSKHALKTFVSRLEKALFDGTVESRVWSSHDVNRHGYVTRVTDQDPGPHRTRYVMSHLLSRRLMYLEGKHVPTIFHYRLKDRYAEWLKVLKQWNDPKRRANAFHVQDRCGLLLVVPEARHIQPAVQAILRFLATLPHAAVIEEPSEHDHGNPDSSHEFKVVKMVVTVDGHTFEIQFQTLADWFSASTATDTVNHDMYRFLQCLGFHFPRLFPMDAYGVDWTSAAVRRGLTEYKRRSLGIVFEYRMHRLR